MNPNSIVNKLLETDVNPDEWEVDPTQAELYLTQIKDQFQRQNRLAPPAKVDERWKPIEAQFRNYIGKLKYDQELQTKLRLFRHRNGQSAVARYGL